MILGGPEDEDDEEFQDDSFDDWREDGIDWPEQDDED